MHPSEQLGRHPVDDEPIAALRFDESVTRNRLRARLVTNFTRAGALDVAYCSLDTPVASLLLAATEQGLVRVLYDREEHDAVARTLADWVSARVPRDPPELNPVPHQVDAYFAGTRPRVEVPRDLRLDIGFRLEVVQHLTDVDCGHIESCAQSPNQRKAREPCASSARGGRMTHSRS